MSRKKKPYFKREDDAPPPLSATTYRKVRFEEVDNGLFLSTKESKKLADNIDELKAYIEKLEILIKHMENHND